MQGMRTGAAMVALLAMLIGAGCSSRAPEVEENQSIAAEPVAEPVDETPVLPDPAPAPEPVAEEPVVEAPPPPEPVAPDDQMLEDAEATGMTARQTGEDAAEDATEDAVNADGE